MDGFTIVFVDESGFYLLPGRVRTYAPCGQTPILHCFQTRDHLSVMSGVTMAGQLYTRVRQVTLTSADSVGFLKHLLRFLGKVLVIWDGSPHSPFKATEADQKLFPGLEGSNLQHYGELAAFDRSVGILRKGLRELKVAQNTIIWYCSDNGGLKVQPSSVGGLRGNKGTVYEGGLRVPGVIEWPALISGW